MSDPSDRFGEVLPCGCEYHAGAWFYCKEHTKEMKDMSPKHSHEPAIPVALDAEGHCLICHLLEERNDLEHRIQFLIDYYVPLSEFFCFTFPDGDTWYKTGLEPK